MKPTFTPAAFLALVCGAIQAQAQSVVYNFSDGTSDGWASSGFSSTPASTVVPINGQNYISVPIGGFQVANVSTGSGTPLFNAMLAAAADPAGYDISYDYYINTANFAGNEGTYLQLGTFVNTGSGYYAQDFSTPNEVQFSGAQLASGDVFSGQVTINMAAVGYDMPADTFYRLGLIENGNGTSPVTVDFTDISVAPVATPEPSSLALLGLAAPVLWKIRRRLAIS